MAAFGEKIQALMDEFYTGWQKEENKGKSKWDVLSSFSEAHQIAVVFGNFNYQVENGGLDQWVYNGYFHDDADKFIDYLETGAELDGRCRTILDKVYKLDGYANETECDRYGSYHDPDGDGDSGFIGDLVDSDAFDTWYYAHCGNDDWWETVSGIIDKTVGRDAALSHDGGEPEEAPPIVAFGERPSPYRDGFYTDGPHPDDRENATAHLPLRVYIENARNEHFGGFTMPLPATAEDLRSFLDKIEIKNRQDVRIVEVFSDLDGLRDAATAAVNSSISPNTLDELNYLAAKIDAMQPAEYETFGAALEAKRHTGSIAELINLTENLDRFELQPAYSPEMYGEFLIDMAHDEYAEIYDGLEQSMVNPAERDFYRHIIHLEASVDKAAYGSAIAEQENGVFTDQGYLTENEGFKEVYRGPEDVPAEYRVLPPLAQEKIVDMERETAASVEKPSVLERIAADRAERAAAPERDAPEKTHKSREPEL